MRLALMSLLMIPLVVGCGDGEKVVDCGEGTHLEDGSCVPNEEPDTDADADADADADTDADADVDTGDTGQMDGGDIDGDGYSEIEGDCDPENPLIHPAATDVFGDGIDLNCDGVDGLDSDGDGFPSAALAGDDCDDDDPTVSPAMTEDTCNGIDNDCNGLVDDGAPCPAEVRHIDDRSCDSDRHACVVFSGDDELTSWAAAREKCTSIGYDLATIDDSCEWEWLTESLGPWLAGTTFWGGLHCPAGSDCAYDTNAFEWYGSIDGFVARWLGIAPHPECVRLVVSGTPSSYQMWAAPHPCGELGFSICESSH